MTGFGDLILKASAIFPKKAKEARFDYMIVFWALAKNTIPSAITPEKETRNKIHARKNFKNKVKTLKFSENLIPAILSGEKTITWRLFDDKDLKARDEIMCLNKKDLKPFAKVILIGVEEKSFQEIEKADWEGHEKFANETEMLKTYSDYYKTQVNQDTILKIIKFKLLEKIN